MFLLWHPSLTAINLSYTFPILETSATALCGTTGMYSIQKARNMYRYHWVLTYSISSISPMSQLIARKSEKSKKCVLTILTSQVFPTSYIKAIQMTCPFPVPNWSNQNSTNLRKLISPMPVHVHAHLNHLVALIFSLDAWRISRPNEPRKNNLINLLLSIESCFFIGF